MSSILDPHGEKFETRHAFYQEDLKTMASYSAHEVWNYMHWTRDLGLRKRVLFAIPSINIQKSILLTCKQLSIKLAKVGNKAEKEW